MYAIGIDTYGDPSVLHEVRLADPHPQAGEVRIQVRAAGVAPIDSMMRTGLLAAAYEGLTPPFVPGMEVAGIIDELGPDVKTQYDLTVGASVVAFVNFTGSFGGYSDYVVLSADSVTRAPDGLDMPAAGSFLLNSLTARNTLDTLALPKDSTLVVAGAAGAVGGYLTPLAVRDGLKVIAIASPEDEEFVRSVGAEVFVPREGAVERIRDLFPGGVDAVADTPMLGEAILPVIKDGGQIVSFRPFPGESQRGIRIVRVNVRDRASDHAAIQQMAELVGQQVLPTRVGKVFPATEAAAAHEALDAGVVKGRIVLQFPVR